MNILASASNTTRILMYIMICALVVSFGAIGAVLTLNIAPQYALMGMFLGSALGAFISVYETTVIGCMLGMILGLIVAPMVYYFLDFQTAYLTIFVLSLFGAFLGEPLAYFWREANKIKPDDSEYENNLEIENDKYESGV